MTKETRCNECGSLLGEDGMTAAERVIKIFGGATKLARLTNIDSSSVYRWNYPKEKGGTDGAIPHANHGKILAAAHRNGIKITRSDLV
jgi:hypothetical protein